MISLHWNLYTGMHRCMKRMRNDHIRGPSDNNNLLSLISFQIETENNAPVIALISLGNEEHHPALLWLLCAFGTAVQLGVVLTELGCGNYLSLIHI